ncbi:hypothetical protein, unlikely [Trypanosoma brucei gambiense DAL972]|uniref:Uncharacterized protein n=1 Tax=Trypanosoma brucei gambiense (strain MHOM/CI/86/DAL972) TaxID=679716 RepID=C9ZYY8_TRYB9|nr:hypothetical protein, unlikely [Trypanosoma brucei gambiense DAL972]CBH14637.1 hypothetical protein, unlikely [Trypanosoma brucei gambiense DAL972]|eukprot:XP_011776903.1 hypothetical protein, unlikely [Trypanosoma brucei gambiense DAL972]
MCVCVCVGDGGTCAGGNYTTRETSHDFTIGGNVGVADCDAFVCLFVRLSVLILPLTLELCLIRCFFLFIRYVLLYLVMGPSNSQKTRQKQQQQGKKKWNVKKEEIKLNESHDEGMHVKGEGKMKLYLYKRYHL